MTAVEFNIILCSGIGNDGEGDNIFLLTVTVVFAMMVTNDKNFVDTTDDNGIINQ